MDELAAYVDRLIKFEDTTLHDQWKSADGGSTLLGAIHTNDQVQAQIVYVQIANWWLERVVDALRRKAESPGANWPTLDRLYLKILQRRDALVRLGRGQPTPGSEGKIAAEAQKLIATAAPDLEKYGSMALIALGLILLIVILK